MSLDDRDLLDKASAASNGADFDALWRGDLSGHGSASEADLALCNHLAFWTGGDPARIDSLFRQSGLMRDKWDREDYRDRTIAKALEGRTEYYTPGGVASGAPPRGRGTVAPSPETPVNTGDSGVPTGWHPLAPSLAPLPAPCECSTSNGCSPPPAARPVDGRTDPGGRVRDDARRPRGTRQEHARARARRRGRPRRRHRRDANHAPGRVLYIDAENGEREAHRRVHGLNVKPGTLIYVEADGFNLKTHMHEIEALVDAHNPGLLILDSLRSLAPGLDENDSMQAEAALRPIVRLTQARQLATLILHHASRASGEYRGSTAIGAAVELGFTLSRHEDDPNATRRKLSCWKSVRRPNPRRCGSRSNRISPAAS